MTDPLRPPVTDDEPWSYADDLAPARGCVFGILLGLALWALLILVAVIVWRLR